MKVNLDFLIKLHFSLFTTDFLCIFSTNWETEWCNATQHALRWFWGASLFNYCKTQIETVTGQRRRTRRPFTGIIMISIYSWLCSAKVLMGLSVCLQWKEGKSLLVQCRENRRIFSLLQCATFCNRRWAERVNEYRLAQFRGELF